MKNLVLPAILALSLTACNDTSFSHKAKEGTAIAVVNGVNITKEEVDVNFASLPANLTAGREETIKTSIVDQLIKQELVLQDADNSKIVNDKEFKELYNNMSRNFAYNYMVNKAVQDATTEDAIKAAYEENKATYIYKTVKARHILQKTEADAKAIIAELNKGKDFAELATSKSTGPSAKTGGDLGWFKANDMVPEFANAAFALEKGTFSQEPVQTQFGWHVILVEDSKEDNMANFDMVKEPLQKQLANQAMTKYLEGLKKEAKINMIEAPKKPEGQVEEVSEEDQTDHAH